MSSLKQRLPTSVVLLAVIFVLVQYAPSWVFFAVLQLVILAALFEYLHLSRRKGLFPLAPLAVVFTLIIGASFIVAAVPLEASIVACIALAALAYVVSTDSVERLAVFPGSVATTLFGAIYLGATLNFLYWIRLRGPFALYFLFAVIFVGDTGAYFVGKPFGRRKMTPIASPNKTWEGSAAGLVTAALAAWAAQALFFPALPVRTAVITGLLVHAVAQVSDPFESLFKRAAGVKDSSNALPGHGGFLDRIDSLILAGPVFFYLMKFLW